MSKEVLGQQHAKRINLGFQILAIGPIIYGLVTGTRWIRIALAVVLVGYLLKSLIGWQKDMAEIKRIKKELGR
jgi:hypothetical protein